MKDNSAERVAVATEKTEESADRRTVLAANRTVFAAERTYAAWVRTGLAARQADAGAEVDDSSAGVGVSLASDLLLVVPFAVELDGRPSPELVNADPAEAPAQEAPRPAWLASPAPGIGARAVRTLREGASR